MIVFPWPISYQLVAFLFSIIFRLCRLENDFEIEETCSDTIFLRLQGVFVFSFTIA